MIELVLPFPPSLNRYYRHVRGRPLLSREGRRFAQAVATIVAESGMKPMKGDLLMEIEYYPPDRRERDRDNYFKALFDALQKAGAYANDRQIKKFPNDWFTPVKGGRTIVRLEEIK